MTLFYGVVEVKKRWEKKEEKKIHVFKHMTQSQSNLYFKHNKKLEKVSPKKLQANPLLKKPTPIPSFHPFL